jgi:uncharacterized protein (TIGR00645 family)
VTGDVSARERDSPQFWRFLKDLETSMHQRNAIEKILEGILFKSRWLLAPFYIGLVISLVLLLGAFIAELLHVLPQLADLTHIDPEQTILAVLSLIDLSLAGNLVVIVVFSGYENFVSKINTENAEDRPSWMGTLDFSGLKMKLIGSIVAISAISLLRAFMELNEEGSVMDEPRLRWMLILHLTFVGSGLLFAAMDYIGNRAEKPKEGH